MPKEIPITLNRPHAAQQKILSEAKRFNVLVCGRRFGKSKLAVNLLVQPALKGFPVGYFTPTYKLLEETFKEVAAITNELVTKKHDQQFIELITGGKIEFWSLDNPMAGRSRKYKRVIVDEAAFHSKLWESWTEAIRPTLTDLKGDAWFLSTPKGKNDFYKLHMRAKAGEQNWATWQMSTYTNPYIDPAEIDDAQKDLPALAFSQEYMAEFNENVANPFGIDFISQCTFPISNQPAVCFGVDVARSFDFTVIIGLDRNCQVCYFERFQKDWRQTTQAIINLPNVPIAIDGTGVGGPIGEDVARVKDVGIVIFTQHTKQQMMEALALAIQQRKITFPEGVITDELKNFEYEYSKMGVKYSAPSGLHDDAVCALALALTKWKSGGDGQYSYI
jgi:phage FluMu gp28-like protein